MALQKKTITQPGQSHQGVEPGKLVENFQLRHQHRNETGNDHRRGRNDKLSYRLLKIEPGQNDEPDGQQHAHVVDQRPGGIPVEMAVDSQRNREKHHLRPQKDQNPKIHGHGKEHCVGV